jgi:hypothetical protein
LYVTIQLLKLLFNEVCIIGAQKFNKLVVELSIADADFLSNIGQSKRE